MARRMRLGAIVAVLACAAAVAGGCTTPRAAVTSPWPVANAERIVPMPAGFAKWPLTGVSAGGSSDIDRRPLSVKVENSVAARPQSGLSQADVVYETLVEGGITRFNCIFQSDVPVTVGPVRSARPSDLSIVSQYDAIFLFSGASHAVGAAVRKAGLPALSPDFGIAAPFTRVRDKAAPHNLYVSTARAYADAEKRGIPTTADVPRLQFGSAPDTTTPIASVTIPFSSASVVRWAYDSGSGSYERYDAGRAQVDAGNGERVSAKNVVVIWVKYDPVGYDAHGAPTYDVELSGRGRASVFRDGQRYDGSWVAAKDSPPRFQAEDGTPIRLAPGNTWMQVVPLSTVVTMR